MLPSGSNFPLREWIPGKEYAAVSVSLQGSFTDNGQKKSKKSPVCRDKTIFSVLLCTAVVLAQRHGSGEQSSVILYAR